MTPVENRHIIQTICVFVVTAYKAMAATLDVNGATRYETCMNRYETWYETGMEPI